MTWRHTTPTQAIAKYYILYDTFFVDLLCVLPTPFVVRVHMQGI